MRGHGLLDLSANLHICESRTCGMMYCYCWGVGLFWELCFPPFIAGNIRDRVESL